MRTFRIGSGTAAILTLSLLLSALSRGEEPDRRQFDIAAQSLSGALNEFARQSGQQILFAPGIVLQKLSPAVRGDMQPLTALKLLLQDSGLTFTTTPNGAVLVGNPRHPRTDTAHALRADVPQQARASNPAVGLTPITVEGTKDREIVRREVRNYVSAITAGPQGVSLGRWVKPTPLCPLVAGLPRADGEYMLKRLSEIATTVGAPLAPEHCRVNFYVVVTSVPDELIDAWSKRDPWMFIDNARPGGTVVRRFLTASTPVRVWYNIAYTDVDGLPLATMSGTAAAQSGSTAAVERGSVRDLWSVIVLVDARKTKGVSFGQLAGYIAMAGLAQIRLDAKLGDASTILKLFSDPGKEPLNGLSPWDQAYLKALYDTQPSEKMQLSEIKIAMMREIAP
jgi:hypothetical protein